MLLIWRLSERRASFFVLPSVTSVEVGAALAVRLSELADGGQVQRLVQVPVAACREAVDGAAAGAELDGCGAVVGGVAVAVREPVDVTGEADEHRRDDRPDAEHVGQGRPRGSDRSADALVRCLELFVEAADVGEELDGQVETDLLGGCGDLAGRSDVASDASPLQAGVLVPYLRWAACLETPSMAPISDQDR